MNASERLQTLFGSLRSLLAEDVHADGWGGRLLELSAQAHALDEDVWGEQWASYIREASHRFPAPLMMLSSSEELERTAPLLPECRFYLQMYGAGIGDEGVGELLESPHFASLIYLGLGSNRIGDEGAKTLASSPHVSSLSTLRLDMNQLGAAGAKALAQSPHLSTLACLGLWKNQIGDEGATALARSPYLTSLVSLNLSANAIGCVVHISQPCLTGCTQPPWQPHRG